MSGKGTLWFILALLSSTWISAAASETRKIDDTFAGDDQFRVDYYPSEGWSRGEDCSTCAIIPTSAERRDSIYNGTWSDSTASPSNTAGPYTVSITFEGTALSIYGFTPKYMGDFIVTRVNASFVLDGRAQVNSRFTHIPSADNPDAQFNVSYYDVDGLNNGTHTVVMTVDGRWTESTAMVDYFVIEYDTPLNPESSPSPDPSQASTSKSVNVGAIAGGVIGGLVGLATLIIAIVYVLRRKKRGYNAAQRHSIEDFEDSLRPRAFLPVVSQYHSSTGNLSDQSKAFREAGMDGQALDERSFPSNSEAQRPTTGSSYGRGSPRETPPGKESHAINEQIRMLRGETELLRRQQQDLLQAVNTQVPPPYN